MMIISSVAFLHPLLGVISKFQFSSPIVNFVKQDFLPEEIRTQRLWHAQENPSEQKMKDRMVGLWGERFKE